MTAGRQAKREWRDITNRTYGVKVAADWRPDGWLADLDLMTVQEAEAAVTDARDGLNAMHRVQAVSEAEVQHAREMADALPGLRARLEAAQTAHKAKTEERDAIPLAAAAKKAQDLDKALAHPAGTVRTAGILPALCGMGVAIRRNKVSCGGRGRGQSIERTHPRTGGQQATR